MKRFKVLFTASVEDQIAEHVLHIARDSITNALAWENRLRQAIHKIGDAPGMQLTNLQATGCGKEVRKLVFERLYLIHYFVNEATETVEITGFRHGMRLPRRDEP